MRSGLPLLLLFLVAACDRPFVPVAEPDIRAAEPEMLSVVQTADSLDLRVEVTSFRAVASVMVSGTALEREVLSDVWAARVPLAFGLNPLAVQATDVDGVVGVDTLFAARLAVEARTPGPDLPAPRGGHTATVLPDGRVLVTGGAETTGSAASDEAFVLVPGGSSFSRLDARMRRARTGHTATPLPDGRVLIVGGRTTEGARDLSAFVGDAEIFDPQTDTFSSFPLQGSPIVRARHTAILRRVGDRLILELLGGEGNIDFASHPRFGIRDDLRPFEITGGVLISLVPGVNSGQGSPIEPMAGHVAVPLTGTPPEDTDYLIAGALFDARGTESTSLILQVRERGLNLLSAPPLRTPRTRAAALRLAEGVVLVLGGARGVDAEPVPGGELYAAEADRYFTIPAGLFPVGTYGLAAVQPGADRICALGGFEANGQATSAARCFSVQF